MERQECWVRCEDKDGKEIPCLCLLGCQQFKQKEKKLYIHLGCKCDDYEGTCQKILTTNIKLGSLMSTTYVPWCEQCFLRIVRYRGDAPTTIEDKNENLRYTVIFSTYK